ncbi:hypothetical protein ES288_A08G083100v1 [Gossypium darwinii]|uniref:Uncharacterized protein n=1 Tax=Gossypium darwinii TaxID=34276 RepID=A0A5D2FJC9_GOSDA|nr:hypothetical protein ES288_A08G083100v1 [Gossypium darwinii]
MGVIKANNAYEEEFLDYEEEDEKAPDSASTKAADFAKKGYVGIHSSGFRDFLLKMELLRSIVDSSFKHPSEVTYNGGQYTSLVLYSFDLLFWMKHLLLQDMLCSNL